MTLTVLEQLDKWVGGESIHVDENGCVPDFSCCGGELACKDTRKRFMQAFVEGDQATIDLMQSLFLEKYLLDLAASENDYDTG